MPEDQKSAIDQFLSDIPTAGQTQGVDIFDQGLSGQVEDPETVVTPNDNREERRAKKALKAERQANMELAAKFEALSEQVKFSRETNADNVDENLVRLYGNDEKGLLAAKITQDLLRQTEERATERALEQFEAQEVAKQQEVATFRAELDEYLDDIEDEFNVDLTSEAPNAIKHRQGFFVLLNKLSPKDRDGVMTGYADPIATWEQYQSQQKPDNNRSKDLASRAMVRGNNSGDSKLEQTAQEKWLKDAGII